MILVIIFEKAILTIRKYLVFGNMNHSSGFLAIELANKLAKKRQLIILPGRRNIYHKEKTHGNQNEKHANIKARAYFDLYLSLYYVNNTKCYY